MAGKTGKKKYSMTRPAPYRAPALSKNIRDEPDREWKQWFINIEARRRAQQDPGQRPFIFSFRQKEDGKNIVIARRQSQPLPLGALLKGEKKKQGVCLAEDLDSIKLVWQNTVGAETARETEIYSFKHGILTITVKSSTLLQELRQFHKDAVIHDLRDVWTASTPLVDIKYRLGKLEG